MATYLNYKGLKYSNTAGAKGQLRVMSTEKGQKMTLKMSTEGNKIPLNFIMRVSLQTRMFLTLQA